MKRFEIVDERKLIADACAIAAQYCDYNAPRFLRRFGHYGSPMTYREAGAAEGVGYQATRMSVLRTIRKLSREPHIGVEGAQRLKRMLRCDLGTMRKVRLDSAVASDGVGH